MQMPAKHASSEVMMDCSQYLIASIEADEETAQLSEEITTIHNKLKNAQVVSEEAHFVLLKKQARFSLADLQLERVVMNISLVELGRLNNNRQAPRYAFLFPHGASYITQKTNDEKLDECLELQIRFLSDPSDPVVTQLSALFEQKIQKYINAKNEVKAADNDLNIKKSYELATRDEWRNMYRATHGKITALFPNDKRRIETYFLRLHKQSKKESEPEPTPPQPNPPSPPAPTN